MILFDSEFLNLFCVSDTDGFVIPSLSVGESDQVEADVPNEKGLKPSSPKVKEEEKIYLGPHGAPPSQAKQQELNATGRKQRLKYKLKEADRKFAGTGRENKVENLRELVGSSKANTTNMGKDSPRDWLDPHCHESQFENKNLSWKHRENARPSSYRFFPWPSAVFLCQYFIETRPGKIIYRRP
ncbi:hypothetical protein ACLOJK_035693 [Asimina triloba]